MGASLLDPAAIDRLFAVKGRDTTKAIAVLLGDPEALSGVASEIGELAAKLASRFWPGPLTLVLARHPSLPENISPLPTIGVRLPDHPIAIHLLRSTGPLAVTSANLSGSLNAVTAQQVYDQLSSHIPLILDGGRTPGGTPSTVVDCTLGKPVILREGPITLDQLLEALI